MFSQIIKQVRRCPVEGLCTYTTVRHQHASWHWKSFSVVIRTAPQSVAWP